MNEQNILIVRCGEVALKGMNKPYFERMLVDRIKKNLKAFDGVDVAGLQEQVTKLKADMKAQAEGFAFDNALNAAIMSKKGRSVKAVRALLDLDALTGGYNLQIAWSTAAAAVKACAES